MRITEPYTIFPRKLSSGRIVYYYQFRKEDGTRSGALSTGCNTSARAKRIVQRLYIEGRLTSHSGETFGNFANGFFDYDGELAEWRKLSGSPIMENTLRTYKAILNYRLIPYFKDIRLSDITVDSVKKWVMWANQSWSPKSVNVAQNCLSMILNNAIEKGIISKNPCVGLGSRKVERRVRELLTVDEIRAIYHGNWNHDSSKKAFLIAAITGMRIGEVLALRKVDVNNGFFDVKHSWNNQFGLCPTKTKQNRKVPIPKSLDVISDTSTEWIIPSLTTEKPLVEQMVYRRFARICEELGIDMKKRNITVHTLRNFFISYMKGKNVPELKIKATVGHTDGSITDWYTYWKPEMLEEVYNAQFELYQEIIKEV